MKPIQFLTHEEIEAHYAKACKRLPLPQILEDQKRHLIQTMLEQNATRYAKSIVGRMAGEQGWSRINLDKDAAEKIKAWQESERWRLWLSSINATFCDRRQRFITTNL